MTIVEEQNGFLLLEIGGEFYVVELFSHVKRSGVLSVEGVRPRRSASSINASAVKYCARPLSRDAAEALFRGLVVGKAGKSDA